jgi:hypothetical protein
MSKVKKDTKDTKESGTSATGQDPVAALLQVARAMPAAEPVTVPQRREMRSVEGRAPAKFTALVLSMAEEGSGNVAGVPIDATASRTALAQATRLRVGAAAARSVARQLEDQALGLASAVAQRALSATTSLEAYARTPEGRSFTAKAAELRTAARGTKRASTKNANGAKPSAVVVEETPSATGPAPVANGGTATHAAPIATANGAATTAS